MQIDVFNGDADGICALVQLRLADPVASKRITGAKRDIQLLEQVTVVPDDQVTVLDISLERNCQALDRILEQGAHVFYVDHHQAGVIPHHPHLTTLINTDASQCTSLLVNDFLHGKYRAWAVTAAFGDNLVDSAERTAEPLTLSSSELAQLKKLGTCINYNGYGNSIDDLHFAPDDLYLELVSHVSPFEFIAENRFVYEKLLAGYTDDMALAFNTQAEYSTAATAVYILPDAAWARRVSGVFGNELANQHPAQAHAVLTYNAEGGFQVSVRAPLMNKTGADVLCSLFPSGGGRKSAAGINHLPVSQLSTFITAFEEKYR
ncbi:MAG: DHH family phosphoesterase [Methylococcaceae bacterium]|nr:DHH family phosphoesterase [Methylococcaceae bacterium]